MVPAKLDQIYPYSDVAVNWKAKIYMGYGTLTANDLVSVGKIQKITSPVSTPNGYMRLYEGLNLGEILERRIKFNRRHQELDASTIVTVDIATELGIYDAAK